MPATFIVCWILMHQPIANQESCTPPLNYSVAQQVMGYVAAAGDSLKLSMSLAPNPSEWTPQQTQTQK